VLAVAATATTADAQALFADGFESAVPARRGGSNYIWYALGPGCEREPYALIPNYHEPGVRELARSQLAAMRASGQDNLALGLFHLRAPGSADALGRVTGTLLDSSAGRLHPRIEQNLVELLADIRGAGFESVILRWHPQGANDARTWEDFGAAEESLLDENWSLVRSVESLLQASGLDWGTDLMVEGAPRARIVELPGPDFIDADRPHMEGWSRYARELWRRYADEFGVERTFGFSFVSDTDDTRIDARVEHLRYVYGDGPSLRLPIAFAFDLYGTPLRDEGWIFRAYHRHLVDEGFASLPWVITETWYDDALAARAISDAMTATGQPVYTLIQWPLRRDATCDPHVSVAPPVDYGAWRAAGF
jgi:hypothetical protein